MSCPRFILRALLALLSLMSFGFGHPGEHHSEAEVAAAAIKLKYHAAHIARGLEKCASLPAYQELQDQARVRRGAAAQTLRAKRDSSTTKPYLTRRNEKALAKFQHYHHNFSSTNLTVMSTPSTLFHNYHNVSCVLTPEVTEGPYYVTGEYIRSNVIETQEGVPVHLEYQYIDISTCKAASGLYVDTWQTNATGVYSGVQATGNGNSKDATNLNNTFLRGVQPTDYYGVASFTTIFPGHYRGRTTHIHLMAHQNGTVLSNSTYGNSSVSHVGQIFFPQYLIKEVEETYPYRTNKQPVTLNVDDSIAAGQADNNYDPFVSYAYIGDSLADGLLMWISIGIDLSANYTVAAAAALTAHGGVASNSSEAGGPKGKGGGKPSGKPPSGKPSGASGTASKGGGASKTKSSSVRKTTTASTSGR